MATACGRITKVTPTTPLALIWSKAYGITSTVLCVGLPSKMVTHIGRMKGASNCYAMPVTTRSRNGPDQAMQRTAGPGNICIPTSTLIYNLNEKLMDWRRARCCDYHDSHVSWRLRHRPRRSWSTTAYSYNRNLKSFVRYSWLFYCRLSHSARTVETPPHCGIVRLDRKSNQSFVSC